MHLLIALMLSLPVSASIKGGVEYKLPKAKELNLKVTKIPKSYPWIERDLDWKVTLPELGSTIISENTETIELKGPYGEHFILPAGSKFYATLEEVTKPKWLQRKGEIKLNYYKLELPDSSSVALEGSDFNSAKFSALKEAKGLAKAGAYSVAGAVIAPVATFLIASKSIIGLGAATNPAVLGTASALGGGIGLVYGIKKKGDSYRLEPGTDIKLKLEQPWYIAQQLTEQAPKQLKAELIKPSKFNLNINEVKTKKDLFGDKCLRISLDYENKTGEELRYTSFQLVDSMGKEYEPSPSSMDAEIFGELPKRGNLNLYFATDFPKAVHELRVLRLYDQKQLASEKLSLR